MSPQSISKPCVCCTSHANSVCRLRQATCLCLSFLFGKMRKLGLLALITFFLLLTPPFENLTFKNLHNNLFFLLLSFITDVYHFYSELQVTMSIKCDHTKTI